MYLSVEILAHYSLILRWNIIIILCAPINSQHDYKRDIVSYSNVKQIDIDQYCKDVSESPTLNNIQETVNLLKAIVLD